MPAEIIDLHFEDASPVDSLRQEILEGLSHPAGEKRLPTMLLYDEHGLRLYDNITTKAPEYYLFGAEEEILKKHAVDIVRAMHKGSGAVVPDEVVVELGAGALRKTSHILLGLSQLLPRTSQASPITYYALDLEERELKRTLEEISMSDIGKALSGKVDTKGMWGTYDDGLKFIRAGGLQSHKVAHQIQIAPRERFEFTRKDDQSTPSPLDHTPQTSSSDFSSSEASSEASSASVPSPLSERSDSTLSSTDSSLPLTPDSASGQPPLHILFLGSTLGNFKRQDSAQFLRGLPLRPGSGDTLLLGMDHDNDKESIEEAYNDPKGYTRQFIMNGLKVAGRTLGRESMFDEDKWEYVNRYNGTERQHEAFFRSKSAHTIKDSITGKEFTFQENELLKIEESFKFSDEDAYALFSDSALRPIQRWTDSTGRYSLWLLERPAFTFPLLSSCLASNARGQLVPKNPVASNPYGVPSVEEWQNLWAAWDCITLKMIPPSMLHKKPIDLRHICLFYLGHIPTFLDIYLSRLLKEPHTKPEYFKDIFERGIDPNVDDPTICHLHSEVPTQPEDWPTLATILDFQSRVRARVRKVYSDIANGKMKLDRKVGRVLFMTYEHEAMHAETLLYMLLQRGGTGTLPPPGFTTPPWTSLAEVWDAAPRPETKTVTLGPADVVIGHDDLEADDESPNTGDVRTHEFGWDVEHPRSVVSVGQFQIEWRPVTNRQFYEFYKTEKAKEMGAQFPASWVEQDGRVQVRTLYGPVPLEVAQDWPVMTTFNNLSIYATVDGGRLPTEPELRLFYDKFESGYEGGSNHGFRHWHPIPATTGGRRNGGKGGNGGVWEWTSTVLEKRDGFVASKLYPGYSSDFFDEAHNVVIGGSYVTIPHMNARRSFRNWYQRNYGYAWVGGRVVYDTPPN